MPVDTTQSSQGEESFHICTFVRQGFFMYKLSLYTKAQNVLPRYTSQMYLWAVPLNMLLCGLQKRKGTETLKQAQNGSGDFNMVNKTRRGRSVENKFSALKIGAEGSLLFFFKTYY